MPIIVYNRDLTADDEPQSLELPEGARSLGAAAGLDWYQLPAGSETPIDARSPTPAELVQAKRHLPAVRQLKAAVRRRIEHEVGDIDDLLADQARQIEALTALSVRLAQVVFGGESLDAELKQRYVDRITPVAAALDDGSLLLRGDLEGAADMLASVQARTDAINRIIADDYLPTRQSLLEE